MFERGAIAKWKRDLRRTRCLSWAQRLELDQHLEDRVIELMEDGHAFKEASERAVADMGEPRVVAREFVRERPIRVLRPVAWFANLVLLTVLLAGTVAWQTRDAEKRFLDVSPHITINPVHRKAQIQGIAAELADTPGVASALPELVGSARLGTRSGSTTVWLQGFELDSVQGDKLRSYAIQNAAPHDHLPLIWLSAALADHAGWKAGDVVHLTPAFGRSLDVIKLDSGFDPNRVLFAQVYVEAILDLDDLRIAYVQDHIAASVVTTHGEPMNLNEHGLVNVHVEPGEDIAAVASRLEERLAAPFMHLVNTALENPVFEKSRQRRAAATWGVWTSLLLMLLAAAYRLWSCRDLLRTARCDKPQVRQ